MLFGPLLYFYTCNLTLSEFQWRGRYWLHFLPAPLLMLLWWWQSPVQNMHTLAEACYLANDCEPLIAHRGLYRWAAFISIGVYAFLALKTLRQHTQHIKAHFSAIEDLQLRWLQVLAYFMLAGAGLSACYDLLGFMGQVQRYVHSPVYALGSTLVMLLFAWFAIHQTKADGGFIEPSPTKAAQTKETVQSSSSLTKEVESKYRTSSLTQESASLLWQQICDYMQNEKAYLQPGLKVADIASVLEHPTHHISETINGYAGRSFYDLVNRYRVVEAADRLASQLNTSVTEVGFDVGFNSTSTFFTHFKKHFARTPKKYRQELSKGNKEILSDLQKEKNSLRNIG